MKITVKEVSGAKFEVEVSSEAATVQEIKTRIQEAKGWDVSRLTLVLGGKVLSEGSKSLQELVGAVLCTVNVKSG